MAISPELIGKVLRNASGKVIGTKPGATAFASATGPLTGSVARSMRGAHAGAQRPDMMASADRLTRFTERAGKYLGKRVESENWSHSRGNRRWQAANGQTGITAPAAGAKVERELRGTRAVLNTERPAAWRAAPPAPAKPPSPELGVAGPMRFTVQSPTDPRHLPAFQQQQAAVKALMAKHQQLGFKPYEADAVRPGSPHYAAYFQGKPAGAAEEYAKLTAAAEAAHANFAKTYRG